MALKKRVYTGNSRQKCKESLFPWKGHRNIECDENVAVREGVDGDLVEMYGPYGLYVNGGQVGSGYDGAHDMECDNAGDIINNGVDGFFDQWDAKRGNGSFEGVALYVKL